MSLYHPCKSHLLIILYYIMIVTCGTFGRQLNHEDLRRFVLRRLSFLSSVEYRSKVPPRNQERSCVVFNFQTPQL